MSHRRGRAPGPGVRTEAEVTDEAQSAGASPLRLTKYPRVRFHDDAGGGAPAAAGSGADRPEFPWPRSVVSLWRDRPAAV